MGSEKDATHLFRKKAASASKQQAMFGQTKRMVAQDRQGTVLFQESALRVKKKKKKNKINKKEGFLSCEESGGVSLV